MKKTYIILTLLLTTLLISSCETYDDYDADRKTIVGFTFGTFQTQMNPGQTIVFPIAQYYITTASPVDRTFQIVAVESLTGVTSDNYSFDSTIIIPANEQEGRITVTLTNNSLPTDPVDLIIAFIPTDETVVAGAPGTFTLNTPL